MQRLVKPRRTDHDRCIQIILDYIRSLPTAFQLLENPSMGIEQGPDLLFLNKKLDCIEYVEVELDAKASTKAVRMARRAADLHLRYRKPVRVWMISSSDKWVTSEKKTGVADKTDTQLVGGEVQVFRMSPIDLGIHSITRDFPFAA